MTAFGALLNILTTPCSVMSFQTALLNEMEKQIGPSFKKHQSCHVIKKIPTASTSMPNLILCDTKTVTKYISRYLGRPVIALKPH